MHRVFKALPTYKKVLRNSDVILHDNDIVECTLCTLSYCLQRMYVFIFLAKKVQEGNDQEKAQTERNPHSKNHGGKKQN